MTARVAAAVALLAAAGCLRLPAHPRAAAIHRVPPAVVLATLAERERGLDGARISMRVRASGAAALLSSPAFLAVDRPDRVRLQVLSPFGVTVLDLAIDAARYTLAMPLRNARTEGVVDLGTLADAGASGGDRMILVLALLFRPKIDEAACDVAAAGVVSCRMADGVRAEVTLDDALRPSEERYLQSDGKVIVLARFADYTDAGAQAFPGRIAIQDPATGTTLDATIVRVRHAPPRTAG